jgi:hypothetical protein
MSTAVKAVISHPETGEPVSLQAVRIEDRTEDDLLDLID